MDDSSVLCNNQKLLGCWPKKKTCIQIGSNETVQPPISAVHQDNHNSVTVNLMGGRVVECQPVLSAKQGLSNLAFTPPQ